MSLDARARQASTALLTNVSKDLEVHAMLRELHTSERALTSRRHRAVAGLLVAAVVLGVLAVGATLLRRDTSSTPPAAPAVSATPTPTPTSVTDRQTFALAASLSAAVPPDWDKRVYDGGVDFQSPEGPGISLVMDPTPFGVDKPARLTAESFARWIASRPYLTPTQAVPVTVSGHPAWQVDVRLLDSAKATSTCQPSIPDCVQMVKMPFTDRPTGIGHAQVGRMIFVQYPGRIVWLYQWDAGEATADDLPGVLAVLKPVYDSIQLGPITS
jgi:hypothetical protein